MPPGTRAVPPDAGLLQRLARQTSAGSLVAVMLFLAGCKAEAEGHSPETLVREFVDRMQRVHGDPARAEEAFELISAEGRQNLEERARRATALAGRHIAPAEMLAPSRFTLAFKPRRYDARVEGKWAVVTVTGEDPDAQRAEVRCTREDGQWRVALEFPQLAAIQKRPDAGP